MALIGARFVFALALHKLNELAGFLFGYFGCVVVIPGKRKVFVGRREFCAECAAYCHTDVAVHLPLLTVSPPIALDNGNYLPFAKLIQESVALYSDFAYKQCVLLAGGQSFFGSSPLASSSSFLSSSSGRVDGTPAHFSISL